MRNFQIDDAIRKYFGAYESKNRGIVEGLLADDFTFTSPRDNHINRQAYFERCWPNSQNFEAIQIEDLVAKDDEAFVVYEVEPVHGEKFRNTERFRFAGDKIQSVEVYFGSLPTRKGAGQDEENE